MIYTVLDTNVIVSSMLTPKSPPGRIMKAWEDRLFQICLSKPLFSEIKQVLSRPWLAKKYHILTEQRDQLLWRLRRFSHFVSHLPKLKSVIKEDPADDQRTKGFPRTPPTPPPQRPRTIPEDRHPTLDDNRHPQPAALTRILSKS